MKGVILAGGKGTRLLPATRVLNKHMVPILNRPMITYPLETLVALGVSDIMIVSGGDHIGSIAEFLGDGSLFAVSLTYRVQREAGGIAQALDLAADFVGRQRVAVILGDNVFENEGIEDNCPSAMAHLFSKEVADPSRFGVLTHRSNGVLMIDEKPAKPTTNRAVTGLYIYPPSVFDIIPNLKPSLRGELEITDVNNYFIAEKKCVIDEVKGFWSDAGTPESLYEVTKHVWETRTR